ncbi:AMM_1a_G0031160.mRNA.1.CDS.1 [Saccharomyces cerevisiae]|nr:AMM_1a_G0031160.mRNA.1.CDS.1 [Saccharomyces cerevisiae]CAI6755239.1 AMM_1a_G0031160.mRNA.1.CDS.1 [Saccharomyces cerevisiae]
MMRTKRKSKGISRVSKACERCRRKKIKCDNSKPCFSCVGSQSDCRYENQSRQTSETFFKYTESFNDSFDKVRNMITKLRTQLPSNVPTSLRQSLVNISSEFEEFQSRLYLNLEGEQVGSYSRKNSVETKLIGNYSRSLIRFSSELEFSTTQNINMYFGLYSPLLYLTTTGVAWITKRLFSFSDNKEIRETIYLLLKFLDASSASHLVMQRITSTSPLDYYAKLNKLTLPNEQLTQHILSHVSNDIKANLDVCQITNPENVSDGFMYSLKLMERHHRMLKSSTLSDFLSLRRFLAQDELIYCLCIDFF